MSPKTPPQLPPTLIRDARILSTMEAVVQEYRDVHDAVVQTVDPSQACFTNMIQPLIDLQHRVQEKCAIIYMLRYAAPDKLSIEASEKAVHLFSKTEADLYSRHGLYMLVKVVKDKAEILDSEAKRYLDELYQDFTRCGHGSLQKDEVQDYLQSRSSIDTLRHKFTRNIMDDKSGLSFSKEDLAGLSDEDLERYSGVSKNSPAQYFVPLTRHNVALVLKHAKDPAVRRRVYVADNTKLKENLDIFKEVVLRRDANARRLDYPSHASFRLERRVAKTTTWVHTFLDQLQIVLLPQGREELQLLLNEKASHLSDTKYHDEFANIFPPWDFKFYKRLAEEQNSVDHDRIAEYLPLENTVLHMLDTFADCLQMRFEKLAKQQIKQYIWHDDVEIWMVWDTRPDHQDEFIGHLYMDLFFRPNKHRGCQNVNLRASCIDSENDDTRVYPATILMCDFPVSSLSRCALLKHHEMVSLFHELGHGIHDLVSRTKYSRFHGWRSPPDFAEAPSVMLENWCWLEEELKSISCHYTTLNASSLEDWRRKNPGQADPARCIPSTLLDPLIRSRTRFRALTLLDQLVVSRFDMAIHDPLSHEACKALDPTSIYNTLDEALSLLSVPDVNDRGHQHVQFGHLLSGYDAGYYGYLSALVFATDMFQSAFAQDPRDRAIWAKYRSAVLEPGASCDGLQMLYEFLGRDPSSDALFKSIAA